MGQDRIERDIEIAAPLDRIWELVTVPGFWVNDSAELRATAATEGRSEVVRHADYGDFPVRVEKVDPQQHLSYRWTHAHPGEDLRQDNSTLVDLTLTERPGSVLLTVVESGFSQLSGTDELRSKAFDDNAKGWGECLAAFKATAEQPAA